jgi:aspartate-semialdehyde dehydrogenase
MKRNDKNGESATALTSGLFKVAVVGAASLKGKEIKDILSERNFPATDVRLLDDEESMGQMEAVGDEPTFIQNVLPDQFTGVDFAFYASDAAFTGNTWQLAQKASSEIIDLSYALESQPNAQLRAPWIDKELGRDFSKQLASVPVVIAHPAAVALALLFLRLKKAGNLVHASATVMEPASERGRKGMDELHDQTVNLLSFQQMPTAVFGTQIAFNMVSEFGEGVQPKLGSVQERIARHFRALVGDQARVPSLMLVQAPVFHGYAFSIYIEMDAPVSVGHIESALSGDHIQILRSEESPSNVNVAGATEVQVAVRADTQHPNGFWIWAAADNLRMLASLAVECAEQMVSTRPRGKVQ